MLNVVIPNRGLHQQKAALISHSTGSCQEEVRQEMFWTGSWEMGHSISNQ